MGKPAAMAPGLQGPFANDPNQFAQFLQGGNTGFGAPLPPGFGPPGQILPPGGPGYPTPVPGPGMNGGIGQILPHGGGGAVAAHPVMDIGQILPPGGPGYPVPAPGNGGIGQILPPGGPGYPGVAPSPAPVPAPASVPSPAAGFNPTVPPQAITRADGGQFNADTPVQAPPAVGGANPTVPGFENPDGPAPISRRDRRALRGGRRRIARNRADGNPRRQRRRQRRMNRRMRRGAGGANIDPVLGHPIMPHNPLGGKG